MKGFKLNFAAACFMAGSFVPIANAQLASNKSLTEFYNKKITGKLSEKNKPVSFTTTAQKRENLPSSRSSLKDLARITIKNPRIARGNNSIQPPGEDRKNKLPSNSPKLRQEGTRAMRPQKAYLH